MLWHSNLVATLLWILTIFALNNTMAWSFSNQILSMTKGNLALANSVAAGVQHGMEECQSQFKWDPWNCPKDAFSVFHNPASQPATREKAFVHAIISAGIMYTLTKNCSLGHFDCGCDQSKKASNAFLIDKQWTWGGCSDNVKFGEHTAKEFLDSNEPRTDTGLVNLHNNRVGRRAVKKTMRKMCKCHGVSGSCAVTTCWMRLSDMQTIGKRLRRAFENAKRLDYNGGSLNSERKDLPFRKHELIYSYDSINYCNANLTAGTVGTLGRECSLRSGVGVTRSEAESCKRLCHDCGLKIRTENTTQSTSCKCRFIWCCRVECQTCVTEVTRTFCD
ncbi:protein Wnt-8b-like [Galendromus occidentalis]|uniref:Protein Wnt n=1 Tax=Galendromus occidentalis TaxID=34638 RepID=A0AAJ7WJ45_9ACAR|nr:protein Wnt-8b-like [Galendromus occidentalis]